MKFATLSIMDHHPSLGRSILALYKELLEQIEAAEALRFHSGWIAEHHFNPIWTFDPQYPAHPTTPPTDVDRWFERYVDTHAVGNTKSFDELQEKGLIVIGGPEHCIRMIRSVCRGGVCGRC